MLRSEFLTNSNESKPPSSADTPALKALWFDAKGDWEQAHELVQDDPSSDAAWVHAYLHRKEGDLANASYWYRRAKKNICSASLSDEWNQIVDTLLSHNED